MMFIALTPPEAFWIPLVAGSVAALLVAIVLMVSTPIHNGAGLNDGHGHQTRLTSLSPKWWTREVFTATTWSFKDSWATNVTAVGALLGVTTSSTTFLASVVPNSPLTSPVFIALGIFFGGAVGLSPLVYASFAKRPDPKHSGVVVGTVVGLLISTTITLFATFGELATVAVLVNESIATTGERWLLIAALSMSAVFVFIYALRSFRALTASESSGAQKSKSSLMNAEGSSATL